MRPRFNRASHPFGNPNKASEGEKGYRVGKNYAPLDRRGFGKSASARRDTASNASWRLPARATISDSVAFAGQ
ncbi:hypothetical protein HQ563_11855 [bacterium]|nr:hypothetical protein [bacterium]